METPEPHEATAGTATWSPPLPEVAGFEHLTVETPGLRRHVAVIGEGEPVVLLHGFPQHWWQWRQIAPQLAAAGYRAICPDLRGAGWTEANDPRIEPETHLHDLLALLDALGIERARFVTHDMGAISGGQLAYAHPELVRAMVQLSVPPFFMGFSPKLLPGFRHMPPLYWHRTGRSLAGLFSPEYVARPMSAETIATHLAPMARPEVDGAVRRIYRGMAVPVALRFARGEYKRQRLHPPMLVVYGKLDRPFSEELVRRLCRDPKRYADRFELAFVDDAAHFITDDAPEAVAELVLDWFERVG